MSHHRSSRGRRAGAAAAGLGLLMLVTACKPGDLSSAAGSGAAGATGDAGPATAATLDHPAGLVGIPGGGFYVADTAQCTIRKVDSAGTITTVAGIAGSCGHTGDGGPATAATIHVSIGNVNSGLALGADGALWFADFGSVRRIAPDGTISTVTTVPGFAAGPTATPDGDVYVGYSQLDGLGKPQFIIERVTADGTTTPVATGTEKVVSLAAIDDDHLAVMDYTEQPPPLGMGTGFRLEQVDVTTGAFSALPNTGVFAMDAGLAASPDGTVYVEGGVWNSGTTVTITADGEVVRGAGDSPTVIGGNGSPDPATSAQSGQATQLPLTPAGMALDANGDLLVSSGHVVYRLEQPEKAPAPS
jgi:hypothetical protein